MGLGPAKASAVGLVRRIVKKLQLDMSEDLIEGRWYWVRLKRTYLDPLDDFYDDPCDGWDVAQYSSKAAGGWTNGDCWEDFDKQVFCWRLIPLPEPMKPVVTAVGRILKPKGTEPRIHHVIAVKPDGTAKTIIRRPA